MLSGACKSARFLKTVDASKLCVRHGHRVLGVAPTEGRSLQSRLVEMQQLELQDVAPPTDIGLPRPRQSRKKQVSERLQHIYKQRKDPQMEKLARSHQLLVDLDEVNNEWIKDNGPMHVKKISEHYGIFKHLYDEGYFIPKVPLNILFHLGNDLSAPVYHGNVIKPSEASKVPSVSYNVEDDTLWTLMLTNLDGHLSESNKEYIHWCVSNIPGNNISQGETIVDYLQPIPPRGTGYHRYVFVLYKQEKKMEYDLKRVSKDSALEDRTFVTRDWYSKYQNDVTPAGLSFFQSDWDPCITSVYHSVINMKEPVFEYDFPPPYLKKQQWFPLKKPFNLYMDRYRDPKQINKEYLLLKLKKEHPFKYPEPPLKFPNAHPFPKNTPSWLNVHEKRLRMKWGRVNDI